MTDKQKIERLLKTRVLEHVTVEYAVDYILKIYKNSKRFNYNNFSWGFSAGGIITIIILHFIKH